MAPEDGMNSSLFEGSQTYSDESVVHIESHGPSSGRSSLPETPVKVSSSVERLSSVQSVSSARSLDMSDSADMDVSFMTVRFRVEGMSCQEGCANRLARAFRQCHATVVDASVCLFVVVVLSLLVSLP